MGSPSMRLESGSTVQTPFFLLMQQPQTLRVQPAGPNLTQREATIIASEINSALDRGARTIKNLVIDLSQVHLMTSFGLGMCIDLRNRAKSMGAKVVLHGMNSELRDLFKLMKVDRLFTIVSTPHDLDRALAA